MALNFLVHCGGNEVKYDELSKVPMPQATMSYQPINHGRFSDIIEDQLGNVGYRFGEKAHALSRNGQQYFGMAELKGHDQFEEWGLVAGWRSSYDKSLSAGFVVGSQVFVCDNLAFSGDVNIGRKHTKNVMQDFPRMVFEAVKNTRQPAKAQEARYDKYKSVKMKDHLVNHAIIQMLRQDIITTAKVSKVVEEYYEPSHTEHLSVGKRTNWTLFNAVTEAMKGSALPQLPQRTVKLHTYMDTVCGAMS